MAPSLFVAALLSGVALVLAPCAVLVWPVLWSGWIGSKRRVFGLAIGAIIGLPFAVVVVPWLEALKGWNMDWVGIVAAIALIVWGLLWMVPHVHKAWHALWQKLLPSSWRTRTPDATGWFDGAAMSFALMLLWVPCSRVIVPLIQLRAQALGQQGAVRPDLSDLWVMVVFAIGFAAMWLALVFVWRAMTYKIRLIRHRKHAIKRGIGLLLMVLGCIFLINRDEAIGSFLEDRWSGAYVDMLHVLEEQDTTRDALGDLPRE